MPSNDVTGTCLQISRNVDDAEMKTGSKASVEIIVKSSDLAAGAISMILVAMLTMLGFYNLCFYVGSILCEVSSKIDKRA